MTRYPVQVELDVAWGEMDCLGHVNNMYYLRYFETGRIRYLETIGLNYRAHILVNVRCGFRLPLVYPDKLRVEVGCSRVDSTGFTLAYRLYSHAQEAYVAEGNTMIVPYDYVAAASAALPESVAQAIAALEGV